MGRSRTAQAAADTEVSADSFAHSLSQSFLQCRELGHNWRPWTAAWDRKSKSFHRQIRCTSCKTVRKQVLDSTGHVVQNAYDYPDGYLAKHLQPGTYSRDVFRLEAVTRFLDKASASTAKAS